MFAWYLRFLDEIFSDWSFAPITKESHYRLLNPSFARYMLFFLIYFSPVFVIIVIIIM